MRFRVIGLLMALTTAISADELTLDEAISMALDHNRNILNSRIESSKVFEQRAALRARRLPALNIYVLGSQSLNNLDFTFSQGLLGYYPATGPIPATDVKVRTGLLFTGFFAAKAVQPISPLYRIRQNLKLLDISAAIVREQTRMQEQEVIRNVRRLFYALQQAQNSLQAISEFVALNREIDRLTSEYVAREAVLKSDQLNVQLNLAKAEQSEVAARNRQLSAREQMNHLLGRDVLTAFDVAPLLEPSDLEADAMAARKTAIGNRPEVRQAHLKVSLAEQDIVVKKSEYIPDLNAEFNSLGLANFNRFLPVQINTVGVSLNWDVFDWGRKKHELAEKAHVATQARNAALEADSLAIVEVDEKLRKLQESRSFLHVARLAREAAAENVRLVRNRFQVQASLIKDVLQAQASLQQATAEQDNALAEFWSARADFQRALGADR